MNKKSLLIGCIVVVIASTLSFSFQTQSKTSEVKAETTSQHQADEIPEHIPYIFLFRHLSHLKKQADKFHREGRDGSGFQRRFQQVLVIDDDQFEKLNEIALSCESEVAELDKKAEAIIEAFRSNYPAGEVPEGVIIPPPPPELTALQEERNKTILSARDRLRKALGEREFARFDETVKMRLVPDIKRMGPPDQVR